MRTIFLILFTLAFCSLFAQDNSKVWDYPVKPGSEKWKSLKSHREMVNVCQIPITMVNQLSTKELVKVCLDYPLLFTVTAFNNLQQGFNQVSTEFNGFKELFQRDDFGKILLELYQDIKIDELNSTKSDLEKGQHIFKIFYIELILAQEVVINNLTDIQIDLLIKESYNKAKDKQKAGYSSFQIQASYLVLARVLQFVDFLSTSKYYQINPKRYDSFLASFNLPDEGIIYELDSLSVAYLNR